MTKFCKELERRLTWWFEATLSLSRGCTEIVPRLSRGFPKVGPRLFRGCPEVVPRLSWGRPVVDPMAWGIFLVLWSTLGHSCFKFKVIISTWWHHTYVLTYVCSLQNQYKLVQRCFEPSFRFNRTVYFVLCPIHFGKQQHNVCKKVVLCAAAVACNSWDLSTWLSWEEEGNELSSNMAEPVAAARRHTRRRHASVVMMATLLGKGAPWLYSPIHGLRTQDA